MSRPDLALLAAALHGLAAVGLGAIAAHALQLDGRELSWWNKAVFYQAMHALPLLALARQPLAGRWQPLVTGCMATGALLFSGSLYGLALTHHRALVWLTPAGGLLMLAGWCLLAIYALTHPAHGDCRTSHVSSKEKR